jgi:hypothetical protein
MDNEIIKLEKCDEVIDNWGNIHQYRDQELYKLLITPEDWSDDQTFVGESGVYDIDGLIGKTVQVGPYIFKVEE